MLLVTAIDKEGTVSIIIYIYRLQPKGFDSEAGLEYRAHQIQQCQELIAAYRAQHQLDKMTSPPYNERKHLVLKDDSSSPLESEPATRKRK